MFGTDFADHRVIFRWWYDDTGGITYRFYYKAVSASACMGATNAILSCCLRIVAITHAPYVCIHMSADCRGGSCINERLLIYNSIPIGNKVDYLPSIIIINNTSFSVFIEYHYLFPIYNSSRTRHHRFSGYPSTGRYSFRLWIGCLDSCLR